MKVLFIGGTGIISSACAQLAVDQGHDLTILNRGVTDRPMPRGVTHLSADIHDQTAAAEALGNNTYDVVVDWVVYAPQHIELDIALFAGRTAQYIFISSASAYQRPAPAPITEDMPLANPFWEYSRQKIACEQALMRAHQASGFPGTIVRPTHTYDQRQIPFHERWTLIDRLRRGAPIVVHGDGTSLWTLTHHRDFAVGFNGLFGRPEAIGQAYHITSDEWLTWDEIANTLGAAAGATPQIVHVPSETINRFDADWGAGLLGDKAHTTIFNNAKIKKLVPEFSPSIPFAAGAREIMAWYDAHPERQVVNPVTDALLDKIIAAQRAVGP